MGGKDGNALRENGGLREVEIPKGLESLKSVPTDAGLCKLTMKSFVVSKCSNFRPDAGELV